MEDSPTNSPLKQALITWANNNDVKPPEFAQRMNYSYNHAYQLLRGNMDFTTEALGRFLLSYGMEAAAEVMELADLESERIRITEAGREALAEREG